MRVRLIAVLALLGLLVGLNAGCLSLSLFNRESADTRSRLEALEHRVSALEMGNAARTGQPVVVPNGSWQSAAPGVEVTPGN